MGLRLVERREHWWTDWSRKTGPVPLVCAQGVRVYVHVCVAHLVFVIQQLGELRDGARCQLGIVLVVDQVDDGRLQQLRGFGQALDVGHLGRVRLSRQNGGPCFQRLWEHGCPHPVGPGGDLIVCGGKHQGDEGRWAEGRLCCGRLVFLPGSSLVTVVVMV